MLITLTAVNSQEKQSKTGKAYTSVGIKTEEHGEKWINGFGNDSTKLWNKGDKIDLEITDDPKWGLQFKALKVTDVLSGRVEQLEKKVAWLYSQMTGKEPNTGVGATVLPAIIKEKEAFDEAFKEAVKEGDSIPF